MNELQGRLVITDVRVDMEINANTFENGRFKKVWNGRSRCKSVLKYSQVEIKVNR